MTFGGWVPAEVTDFALLERHARLLDSVSICEFTIQRDGGLVDTITPGQLAFLRWARARGIAVWATIAGTRRSLPAGIRGGAADRCVKELAAACDRLKLSGIDVDIEGIPGSARDDYTLFIAKLVSVLHAMAPPRRVAATVMDFPSAADEAAGPFDYTILGRLADEVRVMLYDYSCDVPGPIMPREYFAEELAFARSRIPQEKFVAALPWYGRDWNTRNRETEDLTGLADLGDLGSVTPQWREPEGELALTYTRGGIRHEVWLPDPRKFAWMVDEVRKAGASGIYVWHLGCASPAFLDVVRVDVKL